MPRVKSNVVRLKRKKQIMKAAKGAYGGRSKLWKAAKETVERGWRYAYRDRKNKKRDFRRLWIVRINAAARQHDMSYSAFIIGMHAAGIEVDRKVLADLAVREPQAFAAIAEAARKALEAAKSAASHTRLELLCGAGFRWEPAPRRSTNLICSRATFRVSRSCRCHCARCAYAAGHGGSDHTARRHQGPAERAEGRPHVVAAGRASSPCRR